MTIIRMDKETVLSSEIRIAIPIAPPSRKLFGSKKLFKPNAALDIPRIASTKFLIPAIKEILRFLNPLAISKAEKVDPEFPFSLFLRMDSITIFLQNFFNSKKVNLIRF